MNLWCSMTEISLCIGLILIILYGLFSMSGVGSSTQPRENTSLIKTISNVTAPQGHISNILRGATPQLSGGARPGVIKLVNLYSSDVYFFSRLWPLMLLIGMGIEASQETAQLGGIATQLLQYNGIDILLVVLTVIIMQSFKSFESILLLLIAFLAQMFMLHSCDFISFYICLEAQNFCFLVLCGLQPRVLKHSTLQGSRPLAGVEASIKYLLLSAFSSGVLLFWFSVLYIRTGITTLSWGPLTSTSFESGLLVDVVPQMMMLIALMFKLGGAPLHIWMVDIYSGVKRQLIMYLSTAPKLSLFGFWYSMSSVWADFTVFLFVALSMIIGCFGAYNQPTLRALFAYSTINEIGLLLTALESAGFHSLFQHLSIYIVTMLLLWSNTDKRLFALISISLAGLPPLAGFFGKAWIFNSVAIGAMAGPYLAILLISLFCTLISLVYYLRVFRLFSMGSLTTQTIFSIGTDMQNISTRTYSGLNYAPYKLTSFCVIFLVFAPLFYIKPFVL